MTNLTTPILTWYVSKAVKLIFFVLFLYSFFFSVAGQQSKIELSALPAVNPHQIKTKFSCFFFVDTILGQ